MPVTATEVYAQSSTCLYDSPMAKERMISARDARNGFSEVISAAEHDEIHHVVVRHSKTAAIVVPPEWYRAARHALGDPTNV